MQTQTRTSLVLWDEFCSQAKKRYCSPHFNMEKKMEFYGFKQFEEDQHDLSVDEYKEKFLQLHKYAPEVVGEDLKSKFIEGLRETLRFQVKGSGCVDFLDVVARAKIHKKMEKFNEEKSRFANPSPRIIPIGHRQ